MTERLYVTSMNNPVVARSVISARAQIFSLSYPVRVRFRRMSVNLGAKPRRDKRDDLHAEISQTTAWRITVDSDVRAFSLPSSLRRLPRFLSRFFSPFFPPHRAFIERDAFLLVLDCDSGCKWRTPRDSLLRSRNDRAQGLRLRACVSKSPTTRSHTTRCRAFSIVYRRANNDKTHPCNTSVSHSVRDTLHKSSSYGWTANKIYS